jgi:hypothetical protein
MPLTPKPVEEIPVKIAFIYDLMFDMVQDAYRRTGMVTHQLAGVGEFEGKPKSIHGIEIKNKNDVPRLVEAMLKEFTMVTHIVEALARSATAPGSDSENSDVVMITIHTQASAFMAICPVDTKSHVVKKDVLHKASAIGGNLGRQLPQPHQFH